MRIALIWDKLTIREDQMKHDIDQPLTIWALMRENLSSGVCKLRTTQALTSLPIRAVWSAPLLIAFWKVSYVTLEQVKFQFSS